MKLSAYLKHGETSIKVSHDEGSENPDGQGPTGQEVGGLVPRFDLVAVPGPLTSFVPLS